MEGDVMVRAIGTKSLSGIKAIVKSFDPRSTFSGRNLKDCLSGPIHLAAILHTADILEFLLSYIWEHGEKVEKQTLSRGWTTSTGSSIMKHVLSAEVDLDRINVHGAEFFSVVERTLSVLNDWGFIEPFLKHCGRQESTLVYALEASNAKMTLHLAEKTICREHINMPDPETGILPLHGAIRTERRALFTRLIELGAECDLTGKYAPRMVIGVSKSSSLHVCASHGSDIFFAEQILAAGVPADVEDQNGLPPPVPCLGAEIV